VTGCHQLDPIAEWIVHVTTVITLEWLVFDQPVDMGEEPDDQRRAW
jgi:hypothetical protein